MTGPSKTHGSWWGGWCPGEPKGDLRKPGWALAGAVPPPERVPFRRGSLSSFFLPNFPLFPVLISAPAKGISRPLLDYMFAFMFSYFHLLWGTCLLPALRVIVVFTAHSQAIFAGSPSSRPSSPESEAPVRLLSASTLYDTFCGISAHG